MDLVIPGKYGVVINTGREAVQVFRPFFWPHPVLGEYQTEKGEGKVRLPPLDHLYLPGKLRVQEHPTVKKAAIIPSKKVVYFERNFMERITDLQRKFVARHEAGHVAYRQEWKTDVYAANSCLQKYGYDPLICLEEGHKVLSPTIENDHRYQKAKKWIMQNISFSPSLPE